MPGIFAYDPAAKKVTVTGGTSGSPADFPSWVAADRAGTLTLWTGTPTTGITLTTQVRPCEKLALPLDFIIAGASDIGAGDTIGITGTDAWGNAQTETLTTEANGTFTTSKRFATITQVNCNGFSTGVLTIRQNQWGTIWDKGNAQYELNAKLQIGDGATSTYFADVGKSIAIKGVLTGHWAGKVFDVKANATFRSGILINEANKVCGYGLSIYYLDPYASQYEFSETTGTTYLYSTLIYTSGNAKVIGIYNGRLWNCLAHDQVSFVCKDGCNTFNLTVINSNVVFRWASNSTEKIISLGNTRAILLQGANSFTVRDFYASGSTNGFQAASHTGTVNLVNCNMDNWTFSSPAYGQVFRQHTFDLRVSDVNDNPISGAGVKIYDKNGNLVADLTTGEDGKITQQTLNYKRYYYSGGHQEQDYYPYRLVITRAGYETYEDKFDSDRKMDLEVALASYQPRYPLEVELPTLAPLEVNLRAARLEVEIHG
jgi:hypothetical protein